MTSSLTCRPLVSGWKLSCSRYVHQFLSTEEVADYCILFVVVAFSIFFSQNKPLRIFIALILQKLRSKDPYDAESSLLEGDS